MATPPMQDARTLGWLLLLPFVVLVAGDAGGNVEVVGAAETAGGGGSGEAYSSRGLSGRGRARDGHDGLEFDPPAYLDRW